MVLPLKANCEDEKNAKRLQIIKNIVGDEISIATDVGYSEYYEDEINKKTPKKKKPRKLNMEKYNAFPAEFDDRKYVYQINKDFAEIKNMSPSADTNSYTLPDKVGDLPITGICEGAFENNPVIKKVNFKRNIKKISDRLFKNCTMLEGVQFTNNVKEIGIEAFANCTSLSAIVMKNNIQTIGSKAFANCTNLRTVKITPSVANIADDAFVGCEKAVFYCEENTYGYEYAIKHGFKAVNMKLD
jgi:hypothetical protein